ncbi:MAG: hypothetical protein N2111_12880 [Candidatus Sumerlaeaceae bacterium]|nr:hypothetical protein [Candidatus Sumerlaeaceae bacterium]
MRRTAALVFCASISVATACAGTPVIDGVLDSGAGYALMPDCDATPSARTGFGLNNDCSQIWFTNDATHLYFFVRGRLQGDNNNGLLLMVNASNISGRPAGNACGGLGPGGGYVFGNTTLPGPPWSPTTDWRMDFEVDRGWSGNTGAGPTVFDIDRGRYYAPIGWSYFGNPGTAGSPLTVGDETHAFLNDGGTSSGWELKIPRSMLNNITGADTIQAFAVVVSGSAFFSDDSAPANITGGNPGHWPNFTLISGNQHGGNVFAPVSVSAFRLD